MNAKPRSMNGGGRKPLVTTTGRVVGYARVSTDGQHLDGQLAALKAAGAVSVYREKVSGARSDRPQLQRLLAGLRPGDTLLVTRLDRLARSTRDLLNVLDTVSKAGAAFKSVEDAWCDTSTPHGELMVTILAGLATFERHLIAARTGEGRKRAMAAGVRFGRPRALSPLQAAEALRQREAGKPLSMIAALFGCSARTIMRLEP